MGEVYRARDTRLDRTVAVKILPSEFANDSRLRARFEREAKTISSLNHPHICALYDVGPDYLVMEHCEGKTLAQRIASGPLPFEQVLQYGMEIADALDKAHRQGIIHRDLKPSNVMLTKSGVKLLDFGLAKQHFMSTPAESTLQRVSEEGQFVGTIQYMAPEVLQGKEADARSDIFALGLVLYEMVTGNPAFSGTSKASLIAAILEHEPQPIAELKPTTPLALDRLIRACVAKDPDERIQTAHDVALELKWIAEEAHPTEAKRQRKWIYWSIALVGGLAMFAAALLAWHTARSKALEEGVQRFSIPIDAPALGWQPLAVSPDGSQLVYEGKADGGQSILYLRSMREGEGRPIRGTEGADTPFFSPDGKWIAFVADRKVKKIPLSGGSAATVCDLPGPQIRGGAWGGDDTIVLGSTFGGLVRIPAAGGSPQPLTKVAPNEGSHRWPHFLPDGDHVLFTFNDYSGDWDRAKIASVSLTSGERRTIVNGDYPRYSAGFLLFARFGTLFALRFDPHKLMVEGKPVAVVNDMRYLAFNGTAQYAVSAHARLFYIPSNPSRSERQLVWVGRTGNIEPMSEVRKNYREARLSPDGKTLLVGATELHDDLWSYDFDRQSWTRLTSGGDNSEGVWLPDGKQIIFSSNRNGPVSLFTMPADGSAPAKVLAKSEKYWMYAYSSTPDGQHFTVEEQRPDTGTDILIGTMETGRMERFQASPFDESDPLFSPDGKWIAYQSNESGRDEVYVRRFHGPGKWVISVGGGESPFWRRDGRELFYSQGSKFYAVGVDATSSFHAGKPRLLFDLPSVQPTDVSAEGQRFVGIKSPNALPVWQINVVLNWPELIQTE